MKTAFVTGATRGVGRAIAQTLAVAGWRVFALGRDRRVLAGLRADFGIEPLAIDITDRAELRGLIDDLRIDALVHGALRWPEARGFLDQAEADIDMVLEVNLSTTLHLTRMVLPAMLAAQGGAVLMLAEDAGLTGPDFSRATVSGALAGFCAALEAEFADGGVSFDCLPVAGPETASAAVHLLEQRLGQAGWHGAAGN